MSGQGQKQAGKQGLAGKVKRSIGKPVPKATPQVQPAAAPGRSETGGGGAAVAGGANARALASAPGQAEFVARKPVGGNQKGPSVQGIDLDAAREYLAVAYHALPPAELSQRKAFRELMPEIHLLRSKDYSFAQIAQMLSSCLGFTIQPSTARGYYHEMLAKRQDACEKRLNQSMLVLAECEKLTKDDSMSSMTAKVIAAKREALNRSSARYKASQALGLSDIEAIALGQASTSGQASQEAARANEVGVSEARPSEPLGALSEAKPNEAQTYGAKGSEAQPSEAQRQEAKANEAKLSEAQREVVEAPPVGGGETEESAARPPAGAGGRAGLDGEESSRAAAVARGGGLRCGPLQPGIKPSKQYAGVPAEIYQAGEFEHPAIEGLMLSLEERVYGACLEIISADGSSRLELPREKIFRLQWKKPIPRSASTTDHKFVDLDMSVFGKPKP